MITMTERDARGLADALAAYGKVDRDTGVQLSGYDRGYLTLPDGAVVRLRREETGARIEYVAEIDEGS